MAAIRNITDKNDPANHNYDTKLSSRALWSMWSYISCILLLVQVLALVEGSAGDKNSSERNNQTTENMLIHSSLLKFSSSNLEAASTKLIWFD